MNGFDDVARGIERYVAHRHPGASDIVVSEVDRIVGGASRQTYRFRLQYREGAASVDRRLILRRDPPGSVIETDRRNEYNAYRAFHKVPGVPVPEVMWLEEDESWLEFPFFMLEELVGFEASPIEVTAGPRAAHRVEYGRAKWQILGHIAAADPAQIGLTDVMEAPSLDACWRRELDYWESVIDEDELSPWPIARAAARWMRRNPPPPAQKLSVVHGDYRTGNFLYDDTGGIHGILDWEMVHLGDPLEDLGWSLNPMWDFLSSGYRGGLLERDEAIRIWQEASGLAIDPAALHWWEVFNTFKGQASWVSSAREFLQGQNGDPVMGMAGLTTYNRQDRFILETMGKLG